MGNKITYNDTEYNGSIVNDTGVGEFTSNEGKKNPTGVNSERFNTYGGQYANVASGDYSHAEGNNTTASGLASHAEGQNTQATKPHAHAEGVNTQASGAESHAEGDGTIASGLRSHAEGSDTQATNEEAHAEGDSTVASGVSSHAEGANTLASGLKSHAEGEYTQATHNFTHAEGNHTIASGNVGAHAEGNHTEASGVAAHAEGSETKATGNYSHAGGSETEAYGVGSLTSGWKTYAKGHYSTALGVGTIAAGDWGGIALGQYNVENADEIVSIGQGTQDTQDGWSYDGNKLGTYKKYTTYAIGDMVQFWSSSTLDAAWRAIVPEHGVFSAKVAGTISNSPYNDFMNNGKTLESMVSWSLLGEAEPNMVSHRSTILGFDRYNNLTIGSGNNKVAEYANYIQNSTTIGNGNTITAVGSNTTTGGVIEGNGNSIGGTSNNVHIEGNGNSITDGSSNSHIEGTGHQISGGSVNSHTEGQNNIVQAASYSHTEGQNNTVSVECGHAEGQYNSLISGAYYCHAEGGNNTITDGAQYSHIEGQNNIIQWGSTHSHAEGANNKIQRNYSHVEGRYNLAGGMCSHAQGLGTIAKGEAQTALGEYNIKDTDNHGLYAVIVGNGSSVNITIPTFDTSTSYAVGDTVIHDNDVYECTVATSGNWDINNWTFVRHIEIIDGQEVVRSNAATLTWDGHLDVSGGFSVNGVPIASNANPNISDAYSNSSTYNIGDYCIYNNILYKCNTAISVAEDFDSSKWTQTTVGAELLSIINRVSALETALNGYSFSDN